MIHMDVLQILARWIAEIDDAGLINTTSQLLNMLHYVMQFNSESDKMITMFSSEAISVHFLRNEGDFAPSFSITKSLYKVEGGSKVVFAF